MMKMLSRFALMGLIGGMLGASFSMPAAAAVSDAHTSYAGTVNSTTPDRVAYVEEYLYVYCDTYIYYYRFEYGRVEQPTATLANAASDALFDQ